MKFAIGIYSPHRMNPDYPLTLHQAIRVYGSALYIRNAYNCMNCSCYYMRVNFPRWVLIYLHHKIAKTQGESERNIQFGGESLERAHSQNET